MSFLQNLGNFCLCLLRGFPLAKARFLLTTAFRKRISNIEIFVLKSCSGCGTVTGGPQQGTVEEVGGDGGLGQRGEHRGDKMNRVMGYLGDKCQQKAW